MPVCCGNLHAQEVGDSQCECPQEGQPAGFRLHMETNRGWWIIWDFAFSFAEEGPLRSVSPSTPEQQCHSSATLGAAIHSPENSEPWTSVAICIFPIAGHNHAGSGYCHEKLIIPTFNWTPCPGLFKTICFSLISPLSHTEHFKCSQLFSTPFTQEKTAAICQSSFCLPVPLNRNEFLS